MPFFYVLLSLFNGAQTPYANPAETLTLKWNKAYPDDTIDKSAIGLEWALSYCGAKLPNAPYAIAVSADKITIRISELGFDENALKAMHKLHRKIESSNEYQANKSIDLGRYVTLLIGASEHYYAITGVPKRLDELLSKYALTAETGYVNRSTVSRVHRKIQFSQPDGLSQFLMASEIDSVTGKVYEFETIEIMPNAQLRFGVYDADGKRKNSAASSHSEAGKPAKCLWCHESTIQQMFRQQQDFGGFLSYVQLQQKLIGYNEMLTRQKLSLSGIDFSQKQQHTLTELLYISFMEPSAERLSAEWNIPVTQVTAMLAGMPTHVYDEFPFLGKLYDRNQIERFAPFRGLPVSTAVREPSPIEVNHLEE